VPRFSCMLPRTEEKQWLEKLDYHRVRWRYSEWLELYFTTKKDIVLKVESLWSETRSINTLKIIVNILVPKVICGIFWCSKPKKTHRPRH
jgi:hypothetical protein